MFSCLSDDPMVQYKKKLQFLREVAKADKLKMKKLKQFQNVYRLRGKRSRPAIKQFGEALIDYLDFLMANAPIVRAHLDWMEKRKLPIKVRVSILLAGGKTIAQRTKNASKGINDPRMYAKRKKNLEGRLEKRTPISPNEIRNLNHPL
jgi:hypothetical protein